MAGRKPRNVDPQARGSRRSAVFLETLREVLDRHEYRSVRWDGNRVLIDTAEFERENPILGRISTRSFAATQRQLNYYFFREQPHNGPATVRVYANPLFIQNDPFDMWRDIQRALTLSDFDRLARSMGL